MGENRFRIVIEADNKGRPVIKQAESDLDSLGNKAKGAGQKVDSAFSGMGRASSTLLSTLSGLVGVFGVGFGVAQVVAMADEYQNLNGRLKLVVATQQEQAAVEKELYESSQDARVGYGQTIDLYARMARATKEMNVERADLLTVTDSINKSLIISGASAEAANAALIQLGQGLASGTLRGEELTSVLEQAPRLAEAIASGMGVGIGELRRLGTEGELTAEKILGALLNQTEKINSEFAQMPKTIGQAMTVINNTLGKFISDTDRAGSLTASLAGGIIEVAEATDKWTEENDELLKQDIPAILGAAWDAMQFYDDEVEVLVEVLIAAKLAQLAFNGVVAANPYLVAAAAVVTLNESLKAYGLDLISVRDSAGRFADDIGDMYDVAAGDRDAMTGKWVAEGEQIGRQIAALKTELAAASQTEKPWYLFSAFPDAQAGAENVRRLTAEIEALQRRLSAVNADELKDSVAWFYAAQTTEKEPVKKSGPFVPMSDDEEKESSFFSSLRAQKPSAAAIAEAKKLADEWAKLKEELEKDIRIGGVDGLARDLMEIGIKAEELREAAVKGGGNSALVDSWEKQARSVALLNYNLDEQKKLVDQVAKAQGAWDSAAIAGMTGQEQAIARVRAEFDKNRQEVAESAGLLDKSSADVIIAIQAIDKAEERAVNTIVRTNELGGKSLEELAEKFRDIEKGAMSEFDRGLAEINEKFYEMRDVLPGLIELPGMTFEKLAELDERLAAQQEDAIDRFTRDEGKLTNYWQAMAAGAGSYGDTIEDVFRGIAEATENAFGSMDDMLVDFVVKGKFDFSGFIDSVLADLARLAIQKEVTGPLSSALMSFASGMFGGASSSAAVPFDTTTAVWAHSGGTVGFGGFGNGMRQVQSDLFRNAPRLHNGLAADEFPAILQRGETVTPKGQAAGGGGIVVNLIESPGGGGKVEQRDSGQGGEQMINIFVDQIKGSIARDVTMGSGVIPAAITQTYGLNRVPGGY
jgi:tape measure domain-containing protein